ncbi:acid-sensing ion channel 4 [Elysia marginata]|uniref:Acid-sensing ion channel 4 n=1 Tax=Elysia marginata TaxID=1093978 RepID=A0AAV4JPF0_9GAST|nr:acid-sensing ion channel 4 [Elysia marginata]
MAERGSRQRMVVFGSTLFPTSVREKKVRKVRTSLSGSEHKSAVNYGTLPHSSGPSRVAQARSRHDVSSQTDPCLLESVPGEQRYDQPGSLTADINDIIYSFRSVTTIHGVQHAAAARTRSFRRRLWAILVSMMAIFLTWFLCQQVTALTEHQISTTTTFDLRETMEFPAVTLCNLNQYNKNRVPGDVTIQTVLFYMSEYSRVARELDPDYVEPDLSEVKDVSGEELLQVATKAAPTMKEFLVQCRWKGVLYNCSILFHPTHTPQGRCYTFDMLRDQPIQTASVGEWAGLEVMLNIQQQNSYFSEELQAGIKVVVHRSGDNPFPKRYGWHVRPGVFASVALTQHNRKGLPRPYKAYKNRFCEDTNSTTFVNPLKRYSRYTAANCLEECSVDRMVNLCGCRAFNDAAENGTSPLDSCDCPEECDMVSYTAALSYADFSSRFEQLQLAKAKVYPNIRNLRSSFINIRIFFESMSVDTLRQQPAVSILDILGTVGGQMGIFLGCSILSIIELIEMGLLISIRCSWEIYYTLFRSPASKVAALARKAVEVTSLGRQPTPQHEKQGEKSQESQVRPLMEIPE